MDRATIEWDSPGSVGSELSAVEKSLLILQVIGSQPESSLADILEKTGLPKSTAVRMLTTLTRSGFVQRTSHGQYAVSVKVWRIGSMAVGYDDVRAHVIPALKALVAATGETAHYAVYDNGHAVYVEKVDGMHPIRAYTAVGGQSPAYATATGKALLAWQTLEEIRRVAATSQRHTDTTVVGVRNLLAETRAIQRQGYSVNRGNWREGVWGVGSPVFGRGGILLAAVGISGPRDRIENNLNKWVEIVRRTGRELTRLRGG